MSAPEQIWAYSPECGDHNIHPTETPSIKYTRDDIVDALRSELDEARAQTAAAHEVAAKVANDRGAYEQQAYGLTKGVQDLYRLRDAIRALTPADAKAALDKMLADARAEALREAVTLIDTFPLGADGPASATERARWVRDNLRTGVASLIGGEA